MSGSQEIREYFSELVEPLDTDEILEDMFKKLKEKILSKFAETFDEQNRKTDELEGKIAIQANTTDQLIIKYDENEQYSTHNCLSIYGIECSDDERNDNVLQREKECCDEMNLPLQDENIDRVHGIGNNYADKRIGKKVKSIIVKFNFWKSRQQFYHARSKQLNNSKRKPGQ